MPSVLPVTSAILLSSDDDDDEAEAEAARDDDDEDEDDLEAARAANVVDGRRRSPRCIARETHDSHVDVVMFIVAVAMVLSGNEGAHWAFL